MQKPGKKQSKMQSKKQKQQQKQQKVSESHQKNKQPSQSQQQESDEDIDLNQIQHNQGQQQEEVNFLVAEINEQYYHSLKTIFLRFSQITKITNSQLADAVVQNKEIGNVVLADDEDDQSQSQQDQDQLEDDEENAYSVLTIISGKKKLSKALKKVASKSAESKGLGTDILSLINNETTSILVNQRLPNLPAFVVNSSHEVFKKDLIEMKQKEKKKYDQFCSGYLLNVSEIQFEGSEDLQKLVFSKFQDYQMCQRAKAWWLGERNSTYKKKADMRNLYYLVKTQQYLKGVDKIKTYLEG